MNVKVLIDAVVRQNMILVAQLSTIAGVRAPLAHVANTVFMDLVQELESQGLRQRVIADMFGLALRSYQRKVQRLLESGTEPGRSLWEAVYTWTSEHSPVTRTQILMRFRRDDENMVRGVLDDLVSTGLLYRRGRGESTEYLLADEANRTQDPAVRAEADAALVQVAIYRDGPLFRKDLYEAFALNNKDIDRALEQLLSDGRISVQESAEGEQFATQAVFTAYGDGAGWEAALFDHYQAVVTAITTKLSHGAKTANRGDVLGGSTWTFDVWDGHPHRERVRSLLRRTREEADALLAEVHQWNQEHSPPGGAERVSFYAGQSVKDLPDAE